MYGVVRAKAAKHTVGFESALLQRFATREEAVAAYQASDAARSAVLSVQPKKPAVRYPSQPKTQAQAPQPTQLVDVQPKREPVDEAPLIPKTEPSDAGLPVPRSANDGDTVMEDAPGDTTARARVKEEPSPIPPVPVPPPPRRNLLAAERPVVGLPRAPDPVPPAPGFPAVRYPPYLGRPDSPDRDHRMPPVLPYVRAYNRARDRARSLSLRDWSPDQQEYWRVGAPEAPPDPMFPEEDDDDVDGDEDEDNDNDNDARSERSEPEEDICVIGASTVLPPPETITGPVQVVATIPADNLPPNGGPYGLQIDLPSDYLEGGIDIRTRVRVNHVSDRSPWSVVQTNIFRSLLTTQMVSQVSVSVTAPTQNGQLNVGGDAHLADRGDERFVYWREGIHVDDFVTWHLRAAVASSVRPSLTSIHFVSLTNMLSYVATCPRRSGR